MDLPRVSDIFEDRYELLKVLGKGGFAIVFLALDRSMSRQVAVKFLMPQDGNYTSTISARFMREAEVFGQLQDPHTVTMFDFGRTSTGLLYMVFEFVAGRDLKDLIKLRGSLEPPVAAWIAEQVLLALREAHSYGVLHRDIKPGNILVYELGDDPYRVKLIDFGIAKPTGPEASSITRTGHVVGTLRYMAPEQVLAEPVTFASDIYSLGLVMSEMLTGRPAITGDSQRDMIQQQVSDEPLLVDPGAAPAELRAIVERMMAREPESRYPSAEEVLGELAGIRKLVTNWAPGLEAAPPLVDDPPARRAPSTSASGTTSRQGTPWWLPVVAIIALVLVGAWLLRRSSEPPSRVVTQRVAPTAILATHIEPDAGEDRGATEDADAAVPLADADAPDSSLELVDGCGSPAPFKGVGTMTSAASRPWTVQLPRKYDPDHRYPIVLMFHRMMRSGRQMLDDSKMGSVVDKHGFILFAFNSTDPTTWPDEAIEDVRDALEVGRQRLCVDRSRLYVVGDEAGARFAMQVSCTIPISAYAVGWDSTSRTCQPIVPTARLRWYGTADKNQPPQGGWGCNPFAGEFASAESIEKQWKSRHECDGATRSWGKFAGGSCTTWKCDFAPLVTCETNASHQWPGASAPVEIDTCTSPPPKHSFPFPDVIATFFEKEGYAIKPSEL